MKSIDDNFLLPVNTIIPEQAFYLDRRTKTNLPSITMRRASMVKPPSTRHTEFPRILLETRNRRRVNVVVFLELAGHNHQLVAQIAQQRGVRFRLLKPDHAVDTDK